MPSYFGLAESNPDGKRKFKDSLDTAVFTTKFVLEDSKIITYVTHDAADGAWQFFSDDQFDDHRAIARIISLDQMINIDPTIYDLVDLPLGHFAMRDSKEDQWKIYRH